MTQKISTQLLFLENLSAATGASNNAWPDVHATLVILDRRLLKVSMEFRRWVAQYPHRYAIDSGEQLKSLEEFPARFNHLAKMASGLPPRTMTVLAIGGGSVGDFAGFFASVFKRGVNLVHVPTTWLAAIDSAHGGKTALNALHAKNQLGTFYPASRVVLVKSILFTQPTERVSDAMAELGKIALIDGGDWAKKLMTTRETDAALLWKFLKPAIQAKMKIVERDPREVTGVRQVLNLGHTVGHVFEAAYGWTHGRAVAQGLFFALEFSARAGVLKSSEHERALNFLSEKLGLVPQRRIRPLHPKKFNSLVAKDKKRQATSEVTFVFLDRIGKASRRPVKLQDLLREAQRQGLVSSGGPS